MASLHGRSPRSSCLTLASSPGGRTRIGRAAHAKLALLSHIGPVRTAPGGRLQSASLRKRSSHSSCCGRSSPSSLGLCVARERAYARCLRDVESMDNPGIERYSESADGRRRCPGAVKEVTNVQDDR